MKLSQLLENISDVEFKNYKDVDILGIAYDSRKIKQDFIFVAIEGFKLDGHKYVEDAISKGAKAVIVEKYVDTVDNIIQIKVKDTRGALANISANFYNRPSENLRLVGITGTNGKTTTTYLIKSILEVYNKKVGLIGTIGNIIGDKIEKTNNTTPESLELQMIFNDMVKDDMDTCIMEVSSHSLALNRVDSSDFNIGIFTNLTPEHLDLHKTIENYLSAKLKLFYMTSDYNIINGDDPYGKNIINEIKSLKTPLLTYGINECSDIRAKNIRHSLESVKFTLLMKNDSIDINMDIPGIFTVYNSLAAAACAYAMGIDLGTIKNGLENVHGVKGRFEVVPVDKDFTVIIDFAHTPDGFEKVLSTINDFAKGRKVAIFGCGGDRDRTKRPVMGEIAGKYVDLCVLTSDNSRSEKTEDIIKDIVLGVEKTGCDYVNIPDRRDAIKYALLNSKPNDVIILLGKGHETYQIINDKVLPFDEREIIMDILEKSSK